MVSVNDSVTHHGQIANMPHNFNLMAAPGIVRKYVAKGIAPVFVISALAVTTVFAAPPIAAPAPSTQLRAKADPWVTQKLAAEGASEMLVFLSEQADLSAAASIGDKTQRGQFVLDTLRATADRTQTPLLAMLKTRGLEHRPFWIANMIWVRADAAVADELAGRADVARLAANPSVRMPLPPAGADARPASPDVVNAIEWGVTKIRAPEMWTAGFTGQGIVVAGADTGYDWTHPAIKGKYRGWNGTAADHNFNWHDAIHSGGGVICGANSPAPCDDDRHGTHTMGTMVGDDGGTNQVGVAPGARWIGCRNMDQGNGTPATYAECFQWFIAPTDLAGNNANPSLAPHVINNSWGCPASEGCTDVNVLRTVVESVRAAGILVVASAGNDGPACATVSSPIAIYDASFSVGATDASDNLAGFSSRGPVTVDSSNRMKPDISAPGASVRSSVPGGTYSTLSGTSMAGPHVAGAAALLMSAYPALKGKPEAISAVFERTAVRRPAATNCGNVATTVPNNSFGWGRVDVMAAYGGAPGATLDVDASTTATQYDGPTDGVLVVRYLLGFTGTALTDNALGSTGTTLTDPVGLKARLDSIRPALDIDGDGQARVASDGLLILRYLLGLRGSALIEGTAVGVAARRTSAPDIEAYIKLLLP